MSRRGGANHYDPRRDPRRNQLSPATSQQSSLNAPGSGRGRGANHPDSHRNQPSPPISQQSSINALLSGRGAGRGSHAGHTVPSSTLTPVTVTASSSTSSPVIYHPSVVAPVAAGSSSVSTVPSSSLPTTTELLSSELEKKLTLETVPEASAPSSQKATRFPDRPGFGQVGRKIRVRANHFHVQVATNKVLHHYDVRIFFSYSIQSLIFNFYY